MKKDFGFLFWVHLFLILLCLSSPFWLDWKIVSIAAVLLELQFVLIGGCYLSYLEFGNGGIFWHHYLSKIFPRISRTAVKIFAQIVIPIAVVAAAYILQHTLGYQPLIRI